GFFDMGPFFADMPEVYRANIAHVLGTATAEATQARAAELTLAHVQALACPLLVIHGALGKIYPPAEAQRVFALGGPGSELVVYSDGNHVCNNIAYRYRPLIADWVAERLTVA